ncbi:putative 50S ribosomal protein Mrp49 [Tuber indicum]|nr:putative 50S ribosomal protein Mrp49 [Tuber indicum]
MIFELRFLAPPPAAVMKDCVVLCFRLDLFVACFGGSRGGGTKIATPRSEHRKPQTKAPSKMVSMKIRMFHLRSRLALIRAGTGAAILPPEVRKLGLTFAMKNTDGHMGPRKFWRNYLPRLKYHNPNVDMQVHRDRESGGDATLVIEFDGGKTETIDVKHKHENDIVHAVLESTKAKPVPTSEEDAEIVAQYELYKVRMEEQLKINKRKRAERRAEKSAIGGIGRPA